MLAHPSESESSCHRLIWFLHRIYLTEFQHREPMSKKGLDQFQQVFGGKESRVRAPDPELAFLPTPNEKQLGSISEHTSNVALSSLHLDQPLGEKEKNKLDAVEKLAAKMDPNDKSEDWALYRLAVMQPGIRERFENWSIYFC